MDDIDIGDDFDSPAAVRAMRKRHARLAREMLQLAAHGLAELRDRGDPPTVAGCKKLLDSAAKLLGHADDAPKTPTKPH